jgi:hypothetical protein
MTTLTASLLFERSNRAATIIWMRSSGLFDNGLPDDEFDGLRLEIELCTTPEAFARHNEEHHLVTRITDAGILFYLCDTGPTVSSLRRPDGYVLVPMSNVVCLNTFGRRQLTKPSASRLPTRDTGS